MSRQTLLDTDYATLWYYPESKIIRHIYHKFIHGQHFRDVLEKGLETMKEHGANKWLSDDRKNSALPTEDLVWSTTDWSVRCMQAGWKHWAIIMPDKTAGQLTMNRILKQYIETGFNVQVFDDPEEAMQWLESLS
ncbi:MAG TPA: STAS/SEC14 domain-containing protein [Aggregatilineales bacterium]|nr:STAS/SEC14 domain-containing protein [Aggregatilineales bacterium]